jgi:hypothetical protein
LIAESGLENGRAMTGLRVALPLALACACAVAAVTVVPRGLDAGRMLHAQDDPVLLTDLKLARSFDAAVAAREIEAALAADDVDLAQSFLDLARDQHVSVDPALIARVEAANSTTAMAARAAGRFGRGFISGEPDDLVGLAGTAVGDLFVFGDIRDAVREGSRLASGEPVDELILGLASVGLVVTAGTYASLGAGTPARVGVSVVKAARKAGRISAQMAEWFGRSLREAVDWTKLNGAIVGAKLTEPIVAVRAAREAVKVEKTQAITRAFGDVGRVQSKAGTQAAFDAMKIAHGPRDLSRMARLAEAKGTRTRAILKTLGRSAIFLTTSAFTLFSWLFSAVMLVWGFFAAVKRTTERATERYCERRRARRLEQRVRLAVVAAH